MKAITRPGPALRTRLLQLVGHAHAVLLFGLAFLAIAVGVARRDVPGAHEERPELRAAPRVAADGERAQRVAVIALPPADEMRAVRLADLQVVLARELERRLHAFRPAGNEVDALERAARAVDQPVGERFGRLAREERGMRVRELARLLADRRDRPPGGRDPRRKPPRRPQRRGSACRPSR